MHSSIKVIIPAYNEADSIGLVIAAIPDIVEEVIVVSNNSTDRTAEVAKNALQHFKVKDNHLMMISFAKQ